MGGTEANHCDHRELLSADTDWNAELWKTFTFSISIGASVAVRFVVFTLNYRQLFPLFFLRAFWSTLLLSFSTSSLICGVPSCCVEMSRMLSLVCLCLCISWAEARIWAWMLNMPQSPPKDGPMALRVSVPIAKGPKVRPASNTISSRKITFATQI